MSEEKSRATRRPFIPEGSDLEKQVDAFLADHGDHPKIAQARQMAATIRKMLTEDVSGEEWRLATIVLKELRHSFRVFADHRNKRKVTVFGSARSKPETAAFKAAQKFGEKAVAEGFEVITGGGPGIMHAANEGAGAEHSYGLNIEIPWEQRANPVVEGTNRLITYHYFFTRKLFFLKESDALVLFPGGYGTLDEAFETLVLIQAGKTPIKPIVMIDLPKLNYWTKWLRFMQTSQLQHGYINTEDLFLWTITYDVNEAVRIITNFYRNYHSQRWLDGRMLLRINRTLNVAELGELNKDFADIITSGLIEQHDALPEEAENGSVPVPEKPRLLFNFDKSSFGRLRLLIDRINSFR
jgi:uncharacterized protein (TIGR00730 family)